MSLLLWYIVPCFSIPCWLLLFPAFSIHRCLVPSFPAFCEPSQRRLLTQHLLQRPRGRAPVHRARFEAFVSDGLAAEDARLPAEDDAGAYLHVVADADLAGQNSALADRARAGDAGERDQDRVFADVAVVADVDEVVEFCAAADASFRQCAAVDGAVGADLHVVFDDQCSLLRELRVARR